jgi:hypothetical protein
MIGNEIRSTFWFTVGLVVSMVFLMAGLAYADCVITFITVDGVTKMCQTCGNYTVCS